MADYYLAWWNVENLFAEENDPNRSEKLQRTLAGELAGWDQTVLDMKLDRLSTIIKKMNSGVGPDILGVCEVESDGVLSELIGQLGSLGRNYKVVHADTKDKRGIDVAFIYDSVKFKVKATEVFNHFILRRNATRDLLQINFYTKPANNRLVLIGNHWPSRLGGEHASEPYRIIAAETLAYWHERIIEIHSKDQAIVAMGDFNDEPFNRSLVEYALSERVEKRVKSKRSRSPYLLNLMWPLMGNGRGSHQYGGVPGMLDQILVNRPVLRDDSPFELKTGSVKILDFDEMVAKTGSDKGGPRRFGRPSKSSSYDPDGFSDHFPVGMVISES